VRRAQANIEAPAKELRTGIPAADALLGDSRQSRVSPTRSNRAYWSLPARNTGAQLSLGKCRLILRRGLAARWR